MQILRNLLYVKKSGDKMHYVTEKRL